MKSLFWILAFLFPFFGGYAQFNGGFISFDNNNFLTRIIIDTTLPNNLWQIGMPQKALFNSSFSAPKAIVTDTLNPYPSDNTSVFLLGTDGDYLNSDYHSVDIDFLYRIDTENLTDYGRLEISLNNGPWLNVAKEGYYTIFDSTGSLIKTTWSNDTVVFTGRSNGWYHFYHLYRNISWGTIIDTVLYRFTFKSCNLSDVYDGWMIDNILFDDVWERTREFEDLSAVFPNPAHNGIHVRSAGVIQRICLLDQWGRLLQEFRVNESSAYIDISFLKPGFYTYKLGFENGTVSPGKFVKF